MKGTLTTARHTILSDEGMAYDAFMELHRIKEDSCYAKLVLTMESQHEAQLLEDEDTNGSSVSPQLLAHESMAEHEQSDLSSDMLEVLEGIQETQEMDSRQDLVKDAETQVQPSTIPLIEVNLT